jgi:WbqC-like protein family
VRLAAHQPQYLPWLGYFDKMDQADLFVLLDTVQYKKNEWQNRNRIRTCDGWQWLTVPVHYRYPMSLREVQVDDASSWRRKHRETLRQVYARAPHRDAVLPPLEALLDLPTASLADLNTRGIRILAEMLGVRTPIVVASTLPGVAEGKDDRLIDLCRRLKCTEYLAGAGGFGYMNLEALRRSGITVVFQEFLHPVYTQAFPGFEPNLSAVDLLMHCGPGSAAMLRRTRTRAA